ncbi:MAG: autotransporter-associated beta strand repeat-containing protein, partial [Lentisphaeria bacterium]
MPHRTLNLTLASSLALTAAAALLATPAALAANFTWDGNGSTAPNPNGGTGTWDLANSNWWDGASNVVWTDTSGTADTATFANTAGTVTLDTSLGALGLNFTTTGYTISGTGTISLGASGIDASTLASGTTAINTNLALVASQTWNVGTGALITSTGVISGSGFGITKTGAGSLTLSGTNTFDGGLTVKSGTVTLNNNTAAGSGAITLGDTSGSANATVGAVFTGTIANAINVVAGSTGVLTIDNRSGNGAVVTFTGAITLANDVTLAKSTGDRNSVTSGDITGTGNITIKNATVDQTLTLGKIGGSYNAIGSITNLSTATGGATVAILSDIGGNVVNITQNGVTKMILSGTNTNTGLVSIQAGVLDFQKAVSLYNNTPGSWTAANIDVKSGATLGLGLGGPGAFASADIDTIRTNLDTATPGQGFESGASLGIDTTGNNATYASTIANPNGGANVLGFVKLGGNTLTLSGPNTYTGPTQITGGALSVASLNSVSGGTASSNLGAPTTVANGTINFFGSSFGNGQLTYTGAGETTDRVLNLSGGGQYTATLDQSGTGLLKFTSDMTFAGASGSKILILQGNTAGTGEFAGAIGNKDANNLTVVRKAGTGTWTLSGANTYTGTTSVNGGILSVASLNSVSGGSASSNLGAPKTVPNGTIAVGSGVTAATLLYTGAGETTDRVINLAGTTGGATIDQSGTGLLKFTSAFTATGG